MSDREPRHMICKVCRRRFVETVENQYVETTSHVDPIVFGGQPHSCQDNLQREEPKPKESELPATLKIEGRPEIHFILTRVPEAIRPVYDVGADEQGRKNYVQDEQTTIMLHVRNIRVEK